MKAVLDLLVKDAKNVALTWFSVITQGHRALAATNVEDRAVQLYALRFALYMALIAFLLNIQLVTTLRENFLGSASVAYTLLSYVEFMSGAVILHAVFRLFGGQARLPASLVVFGFLAAYLPLLTIAFWPLQQSFFAPTIQSGDDFGAMLSQIEQRSAGLSPWSSFVLIVSALAATAVVVWMSFQAFSVFRSIHRLGRWHALIAFILGLIAYVVFVTVFVAPLEATIYQALAIPPKG